MNSTPIPKTLAKPAHRALASEGVTSLEQLSSFTESYILALHGVGKNGMVRLKEAMDAAGVKFSDER